MVLVLVVLMLIVASGMAAMWFEPDPPASREDALVSRLIAGEITGRRYAEEMARLAALDDERHPPAVPPDAEPRPRP